MPSQLDHIRQLNANLWLQQGRINMRLLKALATISETGSIDRAQVADFSELVADLLKSSIALLDPRIDDSGGGSPDEAGDDG